jgi:hypothetical protein
VPDPSPPPDQTFVDSLNVTPTAPNCAATTVDRNDLSTGILSGFSTRKGSSSLCSPLDAMPGMTVIAYCL